MTGKSTRALRARAGCLGAAASMAWIRMHVLLGLALCLAGCQTGESVNETYGTSRSPAAARSLNGTSVLAELFRQRGYRPAVASRVTPRISRFHLVVWFDAPGATPDPEIRKRIDDWLLGDPERRLLYVGGDHDAAVAYWDQAARHESAAQASSALRRRAEAMARADSPVTESASDPDRWWFEVEPGVRTRLDSVITESGRKVDTSGSPVELGHIRLVPAGRSSSLLRAEGDDPLAFFPDDPGGQRSGQVLVAGNGSFLLNGALLDGAARRLADEVIDALAPKDGMSRHALFLASGSLGWSDTIYENVTAWSWINQPPLSFVVPHFLVLGVCFLFTLLPVLGRRRKLETDEQPGFARHLEAIGQLAARKSSAAAVDNWHRQVSARSGKPATAKPVRVPDPIP